MDDSFVVKSHDVSIDRDYINWLHEIKDRYRTSQIKAAIRVNSEKLQRVVGEINPLEKCISEKLQRVVAELQGANNQSVYQN